MNIIAIGDALRFMENEQQEIRLTKMFDSKFIEKYLNKPRFYMIKSIEAYQNNDVENAISYGKMLREEEAKLYQLFSSFIMMKSYERMCDVDKFNYYEKKYSLNKLSN